ncbi:MAG: hypothetical protein PHV34_22395 [Verrucomicrobiae bacterium]|nr:hypothetical protein [Verrucomicrobiae bacterium]
MKKTSNIVIIFSLFILTIFHPLQAAFSPDGGRVSSFGGLCFSTIEDAICYAKKTGFDDIGVVNWNVYDPPLAAREKRIFETNALKCKQAGIMISKVVETVERGAKIGEFFKINPDHYQWLYVWLEINSTNGIASASLPKDYDQSKGLKYWRIKEIPDAIDLNKDVENAKQLRDLPSSQWSIRDDKIHIQGTSSQKYLALVPCKINMVGLVPYESQRYAADQLDKYLSSFKNSPQFYFWAEAVASMGNYCGNTTWPDCSPEMQALFKKQTGDDFDPLLTQIDPIRWQKWTAFKADVVAQALKMIFDVYHKHGVKGSYYIGDCTYSGSCDSLGKAGLDYFHVNSNLPWINTFWGSWEDTPGYIQPAWPAADYQEDGKEDGRPNSPRLLFRGVTNQTLPDVYLWGLTRCVGAPNVLLTTRMHDFNWRYKWIYSLLKQFRPDCIATAYLPSLGPSYYMPDLASFFGNAGYLWDAPIKWKHLDSLRLSKGEIPDDCDLLVLPSEPWMSGAIDERAAAKLENWVRSGHALLVLRAATTVDLFGKNRFRSLVRGITGVDYSCDNQPAESQINRMDASNWMTKDLPSLVDLSAVKGGYTLSPSTTWFKGGRQWGMICSLLTPWKNFSGTGSKTFNHDAICLYQYQNSKSPFLAIRELGNGRVAYVAQEFGMPVAFGRQLLQRLMHWLCRSEGKLAFSLNNYEVEASISRAESSMMICMFNPTSKDQEAGIHLNTPFEKNKTFATIQINTKNPADSRVLLNKDRILWNGEDLVRQDFKCSLAPSDFSFFYLAPCDGKPSLFQNSFIYPNRNIWGFCSTKLRFSEWDEKDQDVGSTIEIRLFLQDQPPFKVPLYYLLHNKKERMKNRDPWKFIEFPPEEIKFHLPSNQHLILKDGNEVMVECQSGQVSSYSPHWKGSYDAGRQMFSVAIQ